MTTLISSAFNNEHLSETKDMDGKLVKITGSEIPPSDVYSPPGSEWLCVFDLIVNV